MPLTLVQLATFLRVARTGNFTRAAEELFLTQPAVTQQMQSLAEHFGTPLFDVTGRRPILTDAGAFLVERSAGIVDGVALLEREMSEFAAARRGTLALGATVTIGTYALPRQLADFKRAAGDVDIRVTVANTTEICAGIRSRRIALALVEGAVEDADFAITPYANDRLRLIVPASGHPLSKRRSVALADLHGVKTIERERGSGTRMLAREILSRAGVVVDAVLVLPSNEGVLRAVEAGLGVAFLSDLAVARTVAAGLVRAVEIRDADLRRTFRIVSLRSRTLSPIAQKFAEFSIMRET